METRFSPDQLQRPALKIANDILRTCVHCGFCTATCPTYVMLGDELDSPRGRIYLMREMLQQEGAPDAKVVKHVDRCLSCLSCMTTCPSGVDYMHLVDHARNHIEDTFTRPLGERLLRGILGVVLPNAITGILTGVILEVSRTSGETAPIMFTGAAFFLPLLPQGVLDQTMALSLHLFVVSTQVPNMPEALPYGVALVLISMVLIMNSLSIALRMYLRGKKKW